jgi:hypothetical protein
MACVFLAICTIMAQPSIESQLTTLKNLPLDQFEAAREIISRGGHAWPEHKTRKPPVEMITLFGDKFTDEEIAFLWPFVGTPLKSLGICRTRMGNEAVALVLERFTGIEGISVSGMPIDDSAVAPLAGFQKLEALTLAETKTTSETLRHIRKQAALEHLELSGTLIDDAGLEFLEALPALKWLSLSNTSITSAGLASLGRITSLEMLFLRNTNVDDSGLLHLSSLNNLDTLALEDTKVTSAGLGHLATLKNLKTLYIENAKVDIEGLKLLQNMPKLEEVRWDGSEAKPGDPRRRFNTLFHLHLPANANKWSKTRRDAMEAGKRDL